MLIQGAYTALVTPFDRDGQIDFEGLKTLIDYQIAGGIDGLVILGTTGETPTLDNDEQKAVISTAISHVRGRIPIMVGCGTNCTKTTVKYAEEAEKLGASSLLVVVPYYNKPTQEGMYQHFRMVAEHTKLPICVYNVASRCGVNLETETLARLVELPNILSVKEASGTIQQITDVIDMIKSKKPQCSIMSGDDILTLATMSHGGHGIISVISNLLPKSVKDLVTACRTDLKAAQDLHYSLKPFVKGAFIESNPIPIKEMMRQAGLPAGPVRLPLAGPTDVNCKKLQELIKTKQPLILHNKSHSHPQTIKAKL